VKVQIKLLNENCRPYQKYEHDAGFDLRANIKEPLLMFPERIYKIPTGVSMAIPTGYYGDVRGRSGLAEKGIICPGGTIDSGYTGEIHVLLFCVTEFRSIKPFERIAQITVTQIPPIELVEVEWLPESERGEKGFGSTGRV